MKQFWLLILVALFSSCKQQQLLFSFINDGKLNDNTKSTAINIMHLNTSLYANCFTVVVNNEQIAIWSFIPYNKHLLIKISYINHGRILPYITQVNERSLWQSPINEKEMADELLFGKVIPMITDVPSAIYMHQNNLITRLPWPWWLIPPSHEVHYDSISNPFIRDYIKDMYQCVFNPDICPFCIVKEAFGRKCDTNL